MRYDGFSASVGAVDHDGSVTETLTPAPGEGLAAISTGGSVDLPG